MDEMDKNRKLRSLMLKQTNEAVAKIKSIEVSRAIMIEEILRNEREDYKRCYERELTERKKLLIPMNFGELNAHSTKYHQTHNRYKDLVMEVGSTRDETHNSHWRKKTSTTHGQARSSCRPISLKKLRAQNSDHRMMKMSMDQYL
jgi:hypothetical protein